MTSIDSLFISFQDALAGRYSLDRELGRGGMGIVYLAREVHLDRMVAIKLLPPEKSADPTLRERFLREARTAAKLSHPNIIPIHSVEDVAGFVFFVMSFVDGETLANRVRTRGPLSAAEGTRVIREVSWALGYAHGQGLVHRDVKPDNILIEMGTGRVLVADFGIASVAGAESDGPVSGTPEFMSPEAVLGKTVDARSDLYALGATAYYAFSGRLPIEGKSATEVLAKHVSEAPAPLASHGLTVPRKIGALVDRCLAKDPEHRPDSAMTLAEQLGAAVQQRRDLPPALRAFVKRSSRMNGLGTIIVSVAIVPIATVVSIMAAPVIGMAAFAVGVIGVPFAYMTGTARSLMQYGFAHQDLEPAFRSEAEHEREEQVDKVRSTLKIDKWAPGFARVSATTLVLANGGLVMIAGSGPYAAQAWSLPLIMASTISLIGTICGISVLQARGHVDTEFWGNLWTGRFGRSAFKVAQKLLGKRKITTAVTHRATELSLGLAAEQLFDSLPRDTRKELAVLPDVMRRLQEDAQLLRKKHDEMNEALASCTAGSPEYVKVRAMRDEMHGKLAETITALETIRLNLLRLHAGAGSVQSITTNISVAAEVSAAVERLVSAHEEVDRTLKFPRAIAPSPA
jgi:serine/threonine-protein kinase